MAATLKETRSKEELANIEREAWHLRVKGWTTYRIAAHLGVHATTIARMLARIEKRLADRFEKDAHQIKGRQTEILERIAEVALEQFERSCEDAEKRRTVSKRVSSKPAGEERASDMLSDVPDDLEESAFVIEETTEVTGQSGNPALLAQARGALADVRTIWGLDAPKRQELTGRDGGAIPLTIVEAINTVYGDGDAGTGSEEPDPDEE
jgi:hypothetical protein